MLSLINFYDRRFNTITEIASKILAISITILMIFFIMISTVILTLKRNGLIGDIFYDKYFSTLTNSLSTKRIISNYWQVLVLIRWTLVSVILVFLKNHAEFQIICNLILSFFFTAMLIVSPPFNDKN